jgi:predicted transcriptional regulator
MDTTLPSNLIDLKKILSQIFQLTPKQIDVFWNLREKGIEGCCIVNLTIIMKKERSLLQKQLSNLIKKGLIHRSTLTLGEFNERCKKLQMGTLEKPHDKGYMYLYQPISDQEIYELAIKTITNWKNILQQSLRL